MVTHGEGRILGGGYPRHCILQQQIARFALVLVKVTNLQLVMLSTEMVESQCSPGCGRLDYSHYD